MTEQPECALEQTMSGMMNLDRGSFDWKVGDEVAGVTNERKDAHGG
jgi:hypothetical protein